MSIRDQNLIRRSCHNCANLEIRGTENEADCTTCEQPGKSRCEWEPHPILVEGYEAGKIDGKAEFFEQIERLK